MKRLAASCALLALVLLAVARTYAQDSEPVYIPEEAMMCPSSSSSGPFDGVWVEFVVGLVFGVPILPFILGANDLSRRRFSTARLWAEILFLLSGFQALVASFLFANWIRAPEGVPPDTMIVMFALGWSGAGLLAAHWLHRTARNRIANPPRSMAGIRVKVPEAPGPRTAV